MEKITTEIVDSAESSINLAAQELEMVEQSDDTEEPNISIAAAPEKTLHNVPVETYIEEIIESVCKHFELKTWNSAYSTLGALAYFIGLQTLVS